MTLQLTEKYIKKGINMNKFDVLFQGLNEFESMVLKLPKLSQKNYVTQLRLIRKYITDKYLDLMGEVK